MNVLDAAHAIGHDHPGGAKVLALRMGIGEAVFNSKLNPNTATHHLTLVEALRMQQLAQRYDILYAMAADLGHVAIPRPGESSGSAMQALAAFSKEFSDVLGVATETIADGDFSDNDRRRVQTELLELIDKAHQLIPALESVGKVV